MKHQKKLVALALIATPAIAGVAQVSLVNHGCGLIYEKCLNVTWLANANLAATNDVGA